MTRELFSVSTCDQSGNGNQAPISFREFRSLPDVAKKQVVCKRNHFRQKGTNKLLGRCLFLRFRHVFSSFIVLHTEKNTRIPPRKFSLIKCDTQRLHPLAERRISRFSRPCPGTFPRPWS